MNERIKELAEQARQECMQLGSTAGTTISWCELERFAELMRQDERERLKQEFKQELEKLLMEMYYKGANDCESAAKKAIDTAILLEREACAKLCESMGVHPELNVWNGGPEWYKRQKECATAIRARNEK